MVCNMLNKYEIRQDLIAYIENICGVKPDEITTINTEIFADSHIRGVELALIIKELITKYNVDTSKAMVFPSFISIDSLVDYLASGSKMT